MRPGAAKCLACDSFQDWRRFSGVTTPVLSLLVALIAVSSAAAPGIATMFARSDSKLVFAPPTINDQGGLTQFVANDGDRPGVVKGIDVLLPYPNNRRVQLRFFANNAAGQHYIKANSSELITFELDARGKRTAQALPREIFGDDCTSTSIGSNFRSSSIIDLTRWSCAEFVTHLQAAIAKTPDKTANAEAAGTALTAGAPRE
jgi:hypothetical protein